MNQQFDIVSSYGILFVLTQEMYKIIVKQGGLR